MNYILLIFSGSYRELSIKEALWMQQQGETTTTVERVKNMQEEIQQLKYGFDDQFSVFKSLKKIVFYIGHKMTR